MQPLVSIVVASLNNETTIRGTLDSILQQSYPNIEILCVDGASTDGTVSALEDYRDNITWWVSEPDAGFYDALNKGLSRARGDIIGILNADDFYASNSAIETIAGVFARDGIDAVYADVEFVSASDTAKVVRKYSSRRFSPEVLKYGWMPAHPTVFFKKRVFDDYGSYKTDFVIAADYELIVRMFWKHRISYSYVPETLIRMRTGGMSSPGIKSSFRLNQEVLRACRGNGLQTSWFNIILKYPRKALEFFPALKR